jgi:large subunit ribosomal protein L24
MKIREGDMVEVIQGNYKGISGVVQKVLRKKDSVIVQGVNYVTKYERAKGEEDKGGIKKVEGPIRVSKVALICPECDKKTRIGYELKDGKKYRVCRKCNEKLNN